MHTRKAIRLATLLAAIALVAAACGGGTTTATTVGATAEPATTAAPTTTSTKAPATTSTSTTTTTETTSTSEAPTTTTSTTIPFAELPALLDSLGDASGDGEVLAPGEYRTENLSHGMRHVIAEEVSVWQPDGNYIIGMPGFDIDTDPIVAFMDVAGLPSVANVGRHEPPADAERRPVHEAADLENFFSDTPGLVLIDSGTTSDGTTLNHWWEFTTDASAPESFDHCNFGEHCLNIAFVDGCSCYFIAGEEWTYRLWRLGHGHGAMYAWFQAPNDVYAGTVEFGVRIVDGTTIAG